MAIDDHSEPGTGGTFQTDLRIAQSANDHPGNADRGAPASAPDLSIQARIINLLCELRDRLDLSIAFTAHDLAVVQARFLFLDEPTTALDGQ